MSNANHIVVLGGGPAGGATAIGLKRLGYKVTVIAEPRPFKAVEGISDRVVEGLRNAGFELALANLPAPSPRNASWNGATNSANSECLINRSELDQGIVQDLLAAEIEVISARAGKVISCGNGFKVELRKPSQGVVENVVENIVIEADFLVEARGRRAPGAGLDRLRGTETVSLLQYSRNRQLKALRMAGPGWPPGLMAPATCS